MFIEKAYFAPRVCARSSRDFEAPCIVARMFSIQRSLANDERFEATDPLHVCCHVLRGGKCEIRSFSMCNVLAGKAAAELRSLTRQTGFEPRSQMLAQDTQADTVYNITEGVVRLARILPDGRRLVIGFAVPGEFIGMAPGDRNPFSADALTPVTACRFERGQFERFVAKQPSLMRRLHDITSRELVRTQQHIANLGCRSAIERVACFILGLQEKLDGGARRLDLIPLPMSRQDIADHLGLTIETVSRMFTKLYRDGVLEVARDRVRIVDAPRLQALAAI